MPRRHTFQSHFHHPPLSHHPSATNKQDVSGGKPVLLEGVDLPLWGLEVDVEEGRREFAEFSAKNNTADQVRVGWWFIHLLFERIPARSHWVYTSSWLPDQLKSAY